MILNHKIKSRSNKENERTTFAAAPISRHVVSAGTRAAVAPRSVHTRMQTQPSSLAVMEQLTFIDILGRIQATVGQKLKTRQLLAAAGTRHVSIPVQMLLSLPVMVYPGSQVQWVVPCVMVQRDGRTFGPLVAAGRTEAAAVAEEVAADVFVMVTKTEGGGQGERETNKGCGTHCVLSSAKFIPTHILYRQCDKHCKSKGALQQQIGIRGKTDHYNQF